MKIEKNVSCNREDFGFVLCLVFCLKKCRSSLCSASGKEYVPGLGKKSVHFLSDLTATAAFLPSQNPRHFPFTDGHPGDHSGAGIKVSPAIIYQIPILARSLPFQKTPPHPGDRRWSPRLRLRRSRCHWSKPLLSLFFRLCVFQGLLLS